jgi:hypothetical protein
MRYAVAHNVILMSYPGHSTHVLQPLNVTLFAPLQSAYGIAVATHTVPLALVSTRPSFWNFYKLAKCEAYTKDNIKSAWRATGIHPFNSDKVLAKLGKKSVKNTRRLRPTIGTPSNRNALVALCYSPMLKNKN